MTTFADLERLVADRLLRPDATGFAEATVAQFARTGDPPAAVVRVRSTPEVAAAVRAARSAGLPVAVRSGGHSYAMHSAGPGALVVDVRGLDSVAIDPEGLVGYAGGGVTAGAYSRAAGERGLATGFGDIGTVGVGGVALGGGVGFLSRRDGLTVDNVLSADIVLADGSVLTVDTREHPDLFWALRGGGGNFGVVTSFTFRLHPTPVVTGGMLAFAPSPARLAAAVDAVLDAPDGLSAMINLLVAPPLPFLPPELHGRPVMLVLACWSGAPEDAEQALAPLRALGEPLVEALDTHHYPDLLHGPPAPPQPAHPVMRTGFTGRLDEGFGEAALRSLATAGMFAAFNLRPLGGAVGRVPADATAFAHRHREVMVTVSALVQDPSAVPTAQDWVDTASRAVGLSGAGYVNFMSGATPEDVAAAYPGVIDRLREVKAAYDPGNVFRFNHNVSPPGGPAG